MDKTFTTKSIGQVLSMFPAGTPAGDAAPARLAAEEAAGQTFTVTVRRVIVQEQTVTVSASSLRAAEKQAKELVADLGEQHIAAEIGDWRIVRSPR